MSVSPFLGGSHRVFSRRVFIGGPDEWGLAGSGLTGSDITLSSHISFVSTPCPRPRKMFPSQLVAAMALPLGHGMRGFHDTRKHTVPVARARAPIPSHSGSRCRCLAVCPLPTTNSSHSSHPAEPPPPIPASVPPAIFSCLAEPTYPIAHIPRPRGRLSYLTFLPCPAFVTPAVSSYHTRLFSGKLTPSMDELVSHRACRALPRHPPLGNPRRKAHAHANRPIGPRACQAAEWRRPLILLPTLW